MTKKHKIRKSKHLLENKKGVDENVEDILRMIGEENEPDDSGNTFKKSKLSSLVKGFHEDYQYLHTHYKQLISKLENVGHSSTGPDSSDSDSEGDRSDNDVPKPKLDSFNEENGWKQKLAEDHQGEEQSVEAEIENLKQNTEEQAKEISDLRQLLDKAIKDKEVTRVELSSEVAILSSENENLKLVVETAEREAGEWLKTLTFMENEIKTLSSEKQTIEKERDDLKISTVDMENKREDLSNQLQDTVEKCTFLSSQLEKAQLAEKEVQTLLAENQKMKNENLMMSVEYDNMKAHQQNLDIEHSQLKETLMETKAENESLMGEHHSLESKLQLLGVEIDGLTVEKEELVNNLNKEREAAAEEKERLLSEHSKCLNELEKAQSIMKELEKDTWALLVAMAVYDLAAVLLPGGPLRVLLELAIERNEDIPALVYEARPVDPRHGQNWRLWRERRQPGGDLDPNSTVEVIGEVWGRNLDVNSGGSSANSTTQAGEQANLTGAVSNSRLRETSVPDLSSDSPDAQVGEVLALPETRVAVAEMRVPLIQPRPERTWEDEDGDGIGLSSSGAIKLGLGDFIFYSVLVGRAAMYDYMTVYACYLAIIAGLGITLLLLAFYRRALPALPVSITLGVVFYVLTRTLLETFVMQCSTNLLMF